MKKTRNFFHAILLTVVFAAFANAQEFSANNLNIKFTPDGEEMPAAMTRPRVVGVKAEPKAEETGAVTNVGKPVEKNETANFTTLLEKRAFDLINAKRREIGLQPLNWSDDAARIARLHSQNMANYKFFSHTGIDGLMVNDRADRLGVKRWRAIGENIAFNRGYENPVEFAVERWMLSSSHKHNLLDNRWKESAVGIAIANDGSYYFTQVFLQRK